MPANSPDHHGQEQSKLQAVLISLDEALLNVLRHLPTPVQLAIVAGLMGIIFPQVAAATGNHSPDINPAGRPADMTKVLQVKGAESEHAFACEPAGRNHEITEWNPRVLELLKFTTIEGAPRMQLRIGHEQALSATLTIDLRNAAGEILATKCVGLDNSNRDPRANMLTSDLIVFPDVSANEVTDGIVYYFIVKDEGNGRTATEEKKVVVPLMNERVFAPAISTD